MTPHPRVHFAALALFGSWGNLTLIIGKMPAAGIYILMITGVTKELLKFLTLYTTCLIGFVMAFHILNGYSHPELFQDPLTSLMTILVMMVGEINYGDFINNVSMHLNFSVISYLLNNPIDFCLLYLIDFHKI